MTTRVGAHAVLSVSLLVISVAGAVKAVGAQAQFRRAESAFMQNNFDSAEAAYRQTAQLDADRSHRVSAAISLAAIEWRERSDTLAALKALDDVSAVDSAEVRTLLERARMHFAFMKFASARGEAEQALGFAKNSRDSLSAIIQLAQATVEPLLTACIYHRCALSDSEIRRLLPKVMRELRESVRRAPGELEPARILIDAAALAGDGPAMLEGFQSYYLVGTGTATSGPLSGPRETLSRLLPTWRDEQQGQSDSAISVSLRNASLFDAAAVIVARNRNPPSTNAVARETIAYARFVREVRDSTDQYYRAIVSKTANLHDWQAQITRIAKRVWPQLSWNGKTPKFGMDRFTAEIDRRFGAVGNWGRTAGYDDLHMGHRVVDTRRTVEQYGRSANVRFIALDGMVSNGFQSWAWDGRAAHGGWGGAALIVQVRKAYAEDPIRAWSAITDSVARPKRDAAIADDSIEDLKRARVTPVAFFPSVPGRLVRAARLELLDSLVRRGLRGEVLRAEFERLYGDAIVESSIFAHEGRHAIDEKIGADGGSTEKEFRAKLSEVVFAPRPRLAMGAIFDETLGGDSPHGQANARIAAGMVDWIQHRAPEIAGFDPALPALPQLPMLSDKQLREAFASMDPLRVGIMAQPARL